MLFLTLCALLVCEIFPANAENFTPNITSLGYRRHCCDETDVFTTTIMKSGSMGRQKEFLEIPGKGRDWNVTLTRVVVTDMNDNHPADVYVVGGGINKGFIKFKFVSPRLRGLTLHIIAFGYDGKYAYKDTERRRREGEVINPPSSLAGRYGYHHW